MNPEENELPSVNFGDEWFLDIPRATSAPPNLELTNKNLFAFATEYAPWFGDIRCEENYENFYRSYTGPGKLPPPLEQKTWVTDLQQQPPPRSSPRFDDSIMAAVLKEGYQSPSTNNLMNYKQQQEKFFNYPKFEALSINDSWEPPDVRTWNNSQQQAGLGNIQQPQQQTSQQQSQPQQQPQQKRIQQPLVRPIPQNPNLLSPFETNSFYSNLYGEGNGDTYPNKNTDPKVISPMNRSPRISRTPSPTKQLSHNSSPSTSNSYSSVAASSHLTAQQKQQQQYDAFHNALRNTQQQQQQTLQPPRNHQRSTSQPKDASIFSSFSPTDRNNGGLSPGALSPTDDLDFGLEKSPGGTTKNRNEVKYNSVDEVRGRIYMLSKDQYGCRFLQKRLEEGSKHESNLIFEEIYDHIVELMTDPFGNYLCQKLVEHCSDQQRILIIRKVSPEIINIALNMHGTRAVQKLIETITAPVQIQMIIEALRLAVVPLIKDLNGNHVIQRCLHRLSADDKQFIYDAVAGKCVEVATHRHGCCVLQRCIDFASDRQKMQLVAEITTNALTLVQDPFGNYVVQYVLDLGIDYVNYEIIKKFLGHIADLSTNKFSSNVIEKCLRLANSQLRTAVMEELAEESTLHQLLQDSFANYVIQTAMTVCDPLQFQMFNDRIRPMLTLIKNTPYGKKIENKLNKRPLGNSSSGGNFGNIGNNSGFNSQRGNGRSNQSTNFPRR